MIRAHTAPFDTLLVANRGEIACRVLRTARRLGLRTVAVHSDADRDARHVALADVAVRIGPAPATASYLSIEAVLAAARATGAGAIHPGYGFLSENPAFSRACRNAGVVFVGPAPESIEALGNKAAAKRLARAHGVPVLPGVEEAQADDAALVAAARSIGVPLMIKAAAGGGGRGMRRVDDLAALPGLVASARAESRAAFGSDELLLEKLVEHARHVEVQVFGDAHGAVVHLGERDCSTQRRHQKLLEEAPAPGVDAALRARMGEAAVALARAVGYVGAGTVEFLLSPDGSFALLEMNTRLQVEHPVTECVTGLDLVEWQLRVARGEPLPLAQEAIVLRGHAIEARVCAEDPYAGYAPQPGPIAGWSLPADDAADGVRVDHGLAARATVPPDYDSLIAKVIAWGDTRASAIARLDAALGRTTVLGPTTSRDFLRRCLRAEPFAQARLDTGWLDRSALAAQRPPLAPRHAALAAVLHVARAGRAHGALAHWSSTGPRPVPVRLRVGTQSVEVRLTARPPAGAGTGSPAASAPPAFDAEVRIAGSEPVTIAVTVPVPAADGIERGVARVDGLATPIVFVTDGTAGALDDGEAAVTWRDVAGDPPQVAGVAGSGLIVATMHGKVARLLVAPGRRVAVGEPLLALEAMKMEHRLEADVAGTVAEIDVAAGDQVAPGQRLLRIEPLTEAAAPGAA